MSRRIELTTFGKISLDDPFFDSLKNGYEEFPRWFIKKEKEPLYVVINDEKNSIEGMLYLKQESGPIIDINPSLPDKNWLKVGTLKIVSRGTKLGERIIKKIFDTAISLNSDGIYVTVFEAHEDLINLFAKYGFYIHGTKTTDNGIENVLVRSLRDFSGDRLKDYPFIHRKGNKSWLLAIYPEYHSQLLPDSILNNENPDDIVKDVSHTNTIHKVYIGKLPLKRMSPNDIVVFYRTNDGNGPAYYRSVVTSVCVIEEVKSRTDFSDISAFLEYTKPRSVFPEAELRDLWTGSERLYVAKMTYNAALTRRATRGHLIENGIVSEQPRWDLRELTADQLDRILELGEVNARLIID